jgi:hypothetical protein
MNIHGYTGGISIYANFDKKYFKDNSNGGGWGMTESVLRKNGRY